MAKKQNKNQPNAAGTNVEKVKRQNQAAEQGQQQYGQEFAAETNAQEVKRRNQQSQQKKQNQNQNQQNQ